MKNIKSNISKKAVNEQKQKLEQEEIKTEPKEPSKVEARVKEIDNLNKNLMKKLYTDLFRRNVDLYQNKNLTFENFVYHFYLDFNELLDFENPDYRLLLERMDLKVKSKFDRENTLTYDKSKNQIFKELNLLSQEDEWTLIDKYYKALHHDKEEQRKKKEQEDRQKYLSSLNKQISDKKNYIDPVQHKKLNIYSFDAKEKQKKLETLKIKNQEKLIMLKKNIINTNCITLEYLNKLEKDNFEIDENNKDLICYKIDYLAKINNDKFLKDKELPLIVEQIIFEKDLDKIKKNIKKIEYQKELINEMNYSIRNSERPSKMTVEERKMNKELLEKAKAYFNQKYKLSP